MGASLRAWAIALIAVIGVQSDGTAQNYPDKSVRLLGGPPEKLAATLKSEIARWADVAKSASLMAK